MGKWCSLRGIAGHTQLLDDSHEPYHAFPAISAFITSYGREYMRSVLDMIAPHDVYYIGADSIICSEMAYRRMKAKGMIHPTEIGKFKVKGKHERGEIYGTNHHELDGEITASGWMDIATRDGSGPLSADVWESLPGILAAGPRCTVSVSGYPVGYHRPDHKGIVGADGWWQPYRLSDDPDFTDRPPKGGYTDEQLDKLIRPALK